jgi:hypothetical protein
VPVLSAVLVVPLLSLLMTLLSLVQGHVAWNLKRYPANFSCAEFVKEYACCPLRINFAPAKKEAASASYLKQKLIVG